MYNDRTNNSIDYDDIIIFRDSDEIVFEMWSSTYKMF